jgi:hypothetical protein
MKLRWRSFSVALLTSMLMHTGHAQLITPAAPLTDLSAELLSDTKGADLSPYMRSVFSDLKTRWLLLAPNAERRPVPPSDETVISFTIASDGKVSAMHLDHATHNAAQDRAAWGAIASVHYPPLPSELKDSSLNLRVRFPAR